MLVGYVRQKSLRLMAWGDARARRQERKQAKGLARIEARAARVAGRQAVTAEMAKQGMRRGQILGDVLQTGIGAARDVMMNGDAGSGKSKSNEDTKGGDNNAMPLVAGAALLWYLMKKKK